MSGRAEAGRICVGRFVGAHGVRGMVKLKSFTADPAAVADYGLLFDAGGGRSFRLALTGTIKDLWLARVEGVTSREAAQALTGVELWVDRSALPDTDDEDEFYHADLIGLAAESVDGTALGRVQALFDFGAGEMLEIVGADGRTGLVPFTRLVVPVVDIAGGRIVIDPPVAIEAPEGAEVESEGEAT